MKAPLIFCLDHLWWILERGWMVKLIFRWRPNLFRYHLISNCTGPIIWNSKIAMVWADLFGLFWQGWRSRTYVCCQSQSWSVYKKGAKQFEERAISLMLLLTICNYFVISPYFSFDLVFRYNDVVYVYCLHLTWLHITEYWGPVCV